MTNIEQNPNSIGTTGPFSETQILTESPRIKYRQADILLAMASPDPNAPDDPNKFLYEGLYDSALLENIFADKVADGTYRKLTCENNARSGFHRLLNIIESPNSGKQKDALDRAKNAWQTMRTNNPRFDSLSNPELIAIFRKRTIRPNTAKPPKALHTSSLTRTPIPPMTPVELYRDDLKNDQANGEFNFDEFMGNIRRVNSEIDPYVAPFRFPGSTLTETEKKEA